ncbi:MAG TPA: 30S ribosomal protein S6 [bacterium]|nr:30S ribosomal protein S6 [bacterium]
MKLYQLDYIISPEVTKIKVNEIGERIINLIQEQKGVLDKIKPCIEKRLGYLIKNKNSGLLAGLVFYLDPEKLPILENKIKSESEILRYLLLTKKKEKSLSLKTKKVIKEKPKEKVELKEIEKKLEEILGKS